MPTAPEKPKLEAGTSVSKQVKLEAEEGEPESEPPAVIKENYKRPRCRNRPKDELAPPRPKTVYQRVTAVLRQRLGEAKPELQSDIKGMALALKAEWDKVPHFEKDKMQKMYEAEFEVWKLKFAEYKKTQHYKDFFEVKQDWLDAQKRKKLAKKLNKDMPKRPMTSFSLFASDVRGRVAPGCAGPADVARKVAEEWHVLDQEQKNGYIEKSAKLNSAFKAEFSAYKQTEAWKQYCQENAKLQAKQLLKKLMRTKMANAPKKPQSAYGLFYSETMPTVLEENKGTAVSELRKIVQQKWQECAASRREEFDIEANRLRQEYNKQVAEFKRSLSYRQYVQAQAKVKERERFGFDSGGIPNKPPTPFALFAEDHKQKVEPGSGPQESRRALLQKYLKAPMKEKKKYEEQAKALKRKWAEEMRAKKEENGSQSMQMSKVRKNNFQSEAQRILKMTYLSGVPKKPPGNTFKLFVHDSRNNTPLPKEEKQRRIVIDSLKKEWCKTDLATKYRYAVRVKEIKAKWKEDLRLFMTSEKWLEYTKECKRLRLSAHSIFPGKKNSTQKEERGTKLLFPDKPSSLPIIPPRPMELFAKTKMGTAKDNKAVQALWRKMSDRQKKLFVDQTNELKEKYNLEMQKFRESEEGQEYLARMKEVSSKNRLLRAKDTFLAEMPKKPKEALGKFIEAKQEEACKQHAGVNSRELRKILVGMWQALDDVGRAPFNVQAMMEKEEYKKKMIEFKKSESWQKYKLRTSGQVRSIGRRGGRGRGRGRRRGRFGQTAQQIKESRERANSSKKRKSD